MPAQHQVHGLPEFPIPTLLMAWRPGARDVQFLEITPELKRQWFVWMLDPNKEFNAATERITQPFCFQGKQSHQRPASLPRLPVPAQVPGTRAVSGSRAPRDSLRCSWHSGKCQHRRCHPVSHFSSITSDTAAPREALPALRATLGAANQLFTEQRQTKRFSLHLCSIQQSLSC